MTARALRLGAACAVLWVGLGGCSEAFDPRIPDDRAFAVYGTFDGRAPTQRIRVDDVSIPVGRTPEALPATVTSTEITSGVTTVWTDSLVVLDDGGLAHLFVASLTPRAGETHRLRAERDADGATATVEIRLPTPSIALGTSSPELSIRVDLDGLPTPPPSVRVRYRARLGEAEADVISSYGVNATAAGATFFLDLDRDADRVRSALDAGEDEAELLDVVLEGEVASADPVPVDGGIGEVDWIVPFSLPFALLADDIEAARLLDRRGD